MTFWGDKLSHGPITVNVRIKASQMWQKNQVVRSSKSRGARQDSLEKMKNRSSKNAAEFFFEGLLARFHARIIFCVNIHECKQFTSSSMM